MNNLKTLSYFAQTVWQVHTQWICSNRLPVYTPPNVSIESAETKIAYSVKLYYIILYYIILYLFIYLSSYLFIYFFISIHFCKWIRSFGSGIVYTWAWRHRVWAVPLAVNPFVMVRTKRYWSWRHWFTLEFRQNFNVSVIYTLMKFGQKIWFMESLGLCLVS